MTKRNVLIFLAIGVFILVPLVWYAISATDQKGETETTIVDKDTGETFDPAAEIVNTGGNDPTVGDTYLFGILNLTEQTIDNSVSADFIRDVRKALWQYGDDQLKKEFETLTIRPQSLKVNGQVISGELRLGQTETIVPIEILVSSNGKAALTTINKDSNSHGGVFVYVGGVNNPDKLLFSITQDSTRSSNLTIQAFEGYREASLKYIESLGYNVPDFSITFANYESVFK